MPVEPALAVKAKTSQKRLSAEQVEAFYHDQFVKDQVDHFVSLVREGGTAEGVVVDVGGGCGFFAAGLAGRTGRSVRVLDSDPKSIQACREVGVSAEKGDALNPNISGNEDIACFNLILHHLIAQTDLATYELQCSALGVWRNQIRAAFINEYIYDSYIGTASGWLIYQITKSRVLSWVGALLGRIIPSLKANTFGVGVRFRAHKEWLRLFDAAGYDVKGAIKGVPEEVSFARRLLLIKAIRRDSFLLEPRSKNDS